MAATRTAPRRAAPRVTRPAPRPKGARSELLMAVHHLARAIPIGDLDKRLTALEKAVTRIERRLEREVRKTVRRTARPAPRRPAALTRSPVRAPSRRPARPARRARPAAKV